MKIFQFLKIKKIFFLQIFLTLYFVINLVGGERGLISYYDKNSYEKKLQLKSFELSKNLDEFENRNTLLAENINIDYLDKLYREKLKFGKKDEILIEGKNFDILRSGNRIRGMEPRFLELVSGKKATKFIKKGDGITEYY